MVPSCLAERLGDHVALTAVELQALARLEQRERPVRRGTVLVRENEPLAELFVLKRGQMMSSLLLDDGSRQILRFLFPGDMVATSLLVYRRSPETVTTMTDCVVSSFDRSAMADLVVEQPRLTAALLMGGHLERVALTDRLAALGRTPARARVAALLLDIRDRLRQGDDRVGATFTLGLTQEEIGDATGLTAVHVNRMLRQLEDAGLLLRENGRVTILNEPALKRAANHVDRDGDIDFGWLPPPPR